MLDEATAALDSIRKTFHPGMNKTFQHYGLFVSALQPRSFVPGTDMSVIMEMRHGTTNHFDLDLRNNWNATSLLRRIEDIVERIWMDMQKFVMNEEMLQKLDNVIAQNVQLFFLVILTVLAYGDVGTFTRRKL